MFAIDGLALKVLPVFSIPNGESNPFTVAQFFSYQIFKDLIRT